MVSYFVFGVFPLCCCLVVNTSAINCLERLVSEMTYYVSSGMLIPTHSLTGAGLLPARVVLILSRLDNVILF